MIRDAVPVMLVEMFPESEEDNQQGNDETECDNTLDDIPGRLFRKWRENTCFEECGENPEEQQDDESDQDQRMLKERSNVLECVRSIHEY